MSASTITAPTTPVIDRLRAFAAWLEEQAREAREDHRYPTPVFAREVADTYLALLIFAGASQADSDVGASVVFTELRQAIIDLAVKQLLASALRRDYAARAAERLALCTALDALDAFVATGYPPAPMAFPYFEEQLRSWQRLEQDVAAWNSAVTASQNAYITLFAFVALYLAAREGRDSRQARGMIFRCFVTSLRNTLDTGHADVAKLEQIEQAAVAILHPRDGSFLIAETEFGREHPEICVRANITYERGATWVKMLKSPSSQVFDRLRTLGARLDKRRLAWKINRIVPITQLFAEMSGLDGSLSYTTA